MLGPPSLTRRSAVLGALAAGTTLGLSGCSTGAVDLPSGRATAPSQLGTDEQIVVDLVGRMDATLIALRRTRRAFPGLPVAPVSALVRTHRDLLRGASKHLPSPTASATAGSPATTRAAALEQMRNDATTLQQACLDAAARAESGTFARLLASMGCALSQRLQALAGVT